MLKIEGVSNLCIRCNNFPIVNKKHKLCIYCNFERTHNGMTLFEHNSIKQKERIERQRKKRVESMGRSLIVKNPISGFQCCSIKGCTKKIYSHSFGGLCAEHFWEKKKLERFLKKKNKSKQQIKESKIKNELSTLKKESKLEQRNKGNVCEGCLKSFKDDLDYSHILSVAQRKDLETHPDNKNMLCRACHNKWESNSAEKMTSLACFHHNMIFIYQNDKERFWKIYFILNDALMLDECKDLEQIDNEYNSTNDSSFSSY